MAQKTKTVKITGCTQCPHCHKEYVGQGDYSYICTATKEDRVIAYKVEHPAEVPNKTFPDWCPL